MTLRTARVPADIEPIFAAAEKAVSEYFSTRTDDPTTGTIEVFGERYVLVRAAALSVEFFSLVTNLFGEGREAEAEKFARNILFDLAHAIGKSDARNFHAKMNLIDPIERLSAGPIHFAHSGWAFVDISPESRMANREEWCLLYDHPYAFEADAWIRQGLKADFPVCIMNAGYSSGWCEESFGLPLVAAEVLCRARGDECCRFIMAPPDRIEQHIERYTQTKPDLAERVRSHEIPDFFARKRIEEELTRSEQRYRDLSDSLPQTVYEIDAEGNITFVNRSGMEMFGYTQEEYERGLSALQMFPAEEHSRLQENIEGILRDQLVDKRVEYTALRKDGSTFPALTHSSVVIRDGVPAGLRGIVLDTTERQHAQEALEKAKQDWERTFDAVPDLIAIIDTDYRIVRANKAMANRLDLTESECRGKVCHVCVHGSDEPPPACPHTQLMQDGREHSAEIHEPRLDAILLVTASPIFDDDGRLAGCVHVARDITQRRRAEEDRRIKDRLVASSVNPIAMADLQENLTYVNDSFLQAWGFDDDSQVLHRPLRDLWHMTTEAQAELQTKGNWIGQVPGRTRDASHLDLQLSATLVRDELGQPLCMAFSFVNVTEVSELRRRLKAEQSFAGIVGHDAKMLDLFDTISEVAEVGVPVLIQGESGTGKELVAAAIHAEGPRADKPFVPVNCGALPEGILESELFGHLRGAFTGAVRDRKGRFELADGGTIFLDEIGDLPQAMQVKLLRVLQEGAFERVGGEDTVRVDVRIISATNKDLLQEVARGAFREDLFYRLSVVPITLPPLRDRRNDIPLLADHLLKKALADSDRPDVAFSLAARQAIMDYGWPGNVRELENAIQFALVKCDGNVLDARHLPPTVGVAAPTGPTKRRRRKKLDAQLVRDALDQTAGNKLKAAELLGVSRATLYRFLDGADEGG
ncbi:MAG: sigma 54-interacting transcriptional regulator [Planctomycetota bacterium]|jgi:PAS domain S-box-containing protein